MRTGIALACALAMCSIGVGRGEAVTSVKNPPAQTLEAQAAYTAAHGGVTGTCYGCATGQMKTLVARLIAKRFGGAASRALCFARRESGLNPAAISRSDDHGAFQINRPTHPQFNYGRMQRDPAYGVWAGWVVSDHGTDWGPWSGGAYAC